METVSNITSAASRAIWGDGAKTGENETQGKEPLSGEVGDTASGEPYDKGNAEPTTATTEPASTSTGLESTPSSTGLDSSSRAAAPETGSTPATGPIRPEHDTDKTGVTSAHNPTSATSSDKPTSSNDTKASVGAAPESGSAPSQKQQGADRPHEEPSPGESDRIKETKKEAEDAANVDTSGPGPVPLEEKAKVGGGSASAGGDGDDGPQKESHGEGTGEQYVKSSGMKAEGGDFDASKPGAGREADRLLEEKGVHHGAPAKDTPEPTDEKSSTPDSKDTKSSKPSLKEKIKEKLHRHKD